MTFALSNFATTAIIVHQIPFLVEEIGSTEAFAALSVTIMTGFSLFGRLGFGLAADRYSKAILTAVAMACSTIGLKAYGMIQGMLFTASTLGAFFGPLLAGVLYDATADYRPSFLLVAIGPAIALPLILSTHGVSKPKQATAA